VIFFILPKIKPRTNIIDLKLSEKSLFVAVFTVTKLQVATSYFDENVERVRVKSDTVHLVLGNLQNWCLVNFSIPNSSFSKWLGFLLCQLLW
jgi:hypothetical protein